MLTANDTVTNTPSLLHKSEIFQCTFNYRPKQHEEFTKTVHIPIRFTTFQHETERYQGIT